MNTKQRYSFTALLIILSAAISFAAQPSWPTLNGNPIQCNFGFKAVATDTVTLDDVTPIDVQSFLPAGAIGFELRAKSGAFVIAHKSNIATGTDRVGRLVSAGDTYIWQGLAGTFNGSVISNSGAAVVVVDGAWGWYERP